MCFRINESPAELANGKLPIYVVTFPRNQERFNDTRSAMPNLRLYPIEGVDGTLLSPEELSELVDQETTLENCKRMLRFGEVGCYLSHKRALEAFLGSSYEIGVILEDDARLLDSTAISRLATVIKRIPKNTDFIYLGYDKRKDIGWYRYIKRRVACLLKIRNYDFGNYDLPWRAPFWRAASHTHAHALLWTRKGAKKVLAGMGKVNDTYDWMLARLVRAKTIAAYIVIPEIFIQLTQTRITEGKLESTITSTEILQ